MRGLNPCCRGIWSRSLQQEVSIKLLGVLILVVVEYGLGEPCSCSLVSVQVLILVVVEYGLGDEYRTIKTK